MRPLTICALLLLLSIEPISANWGSSPLYDFCAEPSKDNLINAYLAHPETGQKVAIMTPPVPEAKLPGQMPEKVNIYNKPGEQIRFRIAIIPIGYPTDAIHQKIYPFIKQAQHDFTGVPGISFGYVFPSHTLYVEHVEQIAQPNVNQVSKIAESLKGYSPDALIFVINTTTWIGSSLVGNEPPYSFINGENDDAKIIFTHEMAHLLGLDDGYLGYIGKNGIPNTEFFFSIDKLKPIAEQAYASLTLKPRPFVAGRCHETPVYHFEGADRTIMDNSRFRRSNSVFSPLQIKIMNLYIDQQNQKKSPSK